MAVNYGVFVNDLRYLIHFFMIISQA